MNIKFILFLLFSSYLLTGCFYHLQAKSPKEPAVLRMEKALIMGSAESPDPILQKVRRLESKQIVKDVVVLESFPVQIQLTAPQAVINELNSMSRVKH